MTEPMLRYFFLPGAGGGGEQDMAAFAAGFRFPINFEMISYPGWQRYLEEDFSADGLIAELTAEVVKRAPTGPIRLIGLSLGGHFAYLVALRLRESGREVPLFYAIDSFMIDNEMIYASLPPAGWQSRALCQSLELIRKRRIGELARLIRSKAWRAAMRLAGQRLPGLLRRLSSRSHLSSIFVDGSVSEHELSMRLLLYKVVPWIASLERNPVALDTPTILLRTKATANHDSAWRKRCPRIEIRDIPGKHLTLFESENIGSLRDAFVEATDRFTV